uniref:Protein kinase domain-containing protein n=1 Tax=Paramormyrops kingsleyae TaxID=1676925 RepID=A0A3B3QED4_9TELE
FVAISVISVNLSKLLMEQVMNNTSEILMSCLFIIESSVPFLALHMSLSHLVIESSCEGISNALPFPVSHQPENVLVDQMSGQPVVRLVDFGDAVQLSSNPYVHPLLGSPEFAAPELILGQPACLASDIWSLGVVGYVILSGASPFLDESLEETCLNVCRLDFSFPEDYFRGVSRAAKDFTCSLLQGSPTKRPSAALCLMLCHHLHRQKAHCTVLPLPPVTKPCLQPPSAAQCPLLPGPPRSGICPWCE